MKPKPFTLFFLILLFSLGFLGLPWTGLPLAKEVYNQVLADARNQQLSPAKLIQSIDSAIFNNIAFRNQFIDASGTLYRLMERRVIPDANPNLTVFLTKAGQLAWLNAGAYRTDAALDDLEALQAELTSRSIDLLYVNAPTKMALEIGGMPYGIHDTSVINLNALADQMNQRNLPYLDLRPAMIAAGYEVNNIFYRTDHHWHTELGLWSAQLIASTLNARYGLELSSIPDHQTYTVESYPNIFLGSLGRRVGTPYIGKDDVRLLIPTFDTDLHLQIPSANIDRRGTFENSVLFKNHLFPRNVYTGNAYAVNLASDHAFLRITNHLNPDGLKVLVIKDSYANVMMPYLSLSTKELIAVDLRKLNDRSVMDVIDEEQPDAVIVFYSIGVFVSDAGHHFIDE
jgi:hypothetical protein